MGRVRVHRALLLLGSLGSTAAANATLVLFTAAPQQTGAMCLDGSPPGVYLRLSQNASAPWIVAIEGGGWCYNETSCYQRSLTDLGSSKTWAPQVQLSGIESDDCGYNPHFCGWNIAYMPYCDGMSFMGDRDDAIVFSNGTFNASLFARGRRTLAYTLEFLRGNTSFGAAPAVIVDGCSAGGLSTYLHVDTVAQYAAFNARVVGVADAGFFGDLPTVNGVFYARSLLQYEFVMHNASAGVSPACLSSRAPEYAWQCATPQVALPFVSHALFVLQSDFDTYQLQNIFAPPWLPGVDPVWGNACVGNPGACTPAQQSALLTQWLPSFRSILSYAGVFSGGAFGQRAAFLHSCMTHCQWGSMTSIAVNGTLMYDAFWQWYNLQHGADGSYLWLDCIGLHCNPTCSNTA